MSNAEGDVDLIIEALEVFVNQILYLRDVYPAQIFKKRRAYNTPIYASVFPPLNSYMHNVLRTARELHQRGQLRCVEVVFYDALTEEQLECYTFNFDDHPGLGVKVFMQQIEPATSADGFLIRFEEQLRSALYKMAERLKPLDKLPPDTRFKLLVHTTESEYIRITQTSKFQDFPWLLNEQRIEKYKEKIGILPLSRVNNIGLSLVVEAKCDF